MSGDGFPFALPAPCFAAAKCETTTLFEELRKPLLRYLICLGLSRDEAQDTVQDAFLSLHRSLAAGASHENARAWLFSVAHNEARNRQKSHHRRFGAPLEDGVLARFDELTPEQAVLQTEKLQQLAAAMRELTEAERECLHLRAEGLRYREIAEVLQMATSTVADTIGRAVKKLAEKCNV